MSRRWVSGACWVLIACSQRNALPPPAAQSSTAGVPAPEAGSTSSATSVQPPVATSGGTTAAPVASGGAGAPALQPPAANAGAPAPDPAYLGLEAPVRGFRVATRGREIVPESDVEYCEIAEIPGVAGEPYFVSGVELANAEGSHHLIVSVAEPGSPAERQLRTLEIGTQVPCTGAGPEFGRMGMSVLASTQSRSARASLPEGVAQRVFGGQRLVFDYHYFNFGSAALTAKSALAVHTLEAGKPVTLTSTLAFTNMTIDTPPNGEKTFTAVCTLKQDAMLLGVARHTHQHGTDFSVWFEGGARHGQHVWTSKDWEHDTNFHFPEPLLIKAGEGFKFSCGFRNQGSKALRFGISSRDEMCIMGSAIWSPTPRAELEPEECVVTWVDARGIGRSADDAGGYPAAAPADALTCHAGSLGISLVQGCLGCICDACASIMARCNADADCKPLLECNSRCTEMGSTACSEMCEPVMFAHSSGVGLVTQVGECIRAGCGDACAVGMP